MSFFGKRKNFRENCRQRHQMWTEKVNYVNMLKYIKLFCKMETTSCKFTVQSLFKVIKLFPMFSSRFSPFFEIDISIKEQQFF